MTRGGFSGLSGSVFLLYKSISDGLFSPTFVSRLVVFKAKMVPKRLTLLPPY